MSVIAWYTKTLSQNLITHFECIFFLGRKRGGVADGGDGCLQKILEIFVWVYVCEWVGGCVCYIYGDK